MIVMTGITYRIGERLLLDHASATVPSGRRVGLIGRNGAGKTTLLKLIGGELELESGKIETPRGWRIRHLAQEAPSGSASVLDTVLAADEERVRLLAAAETAPPEKLADVHEQLAAIAAAGAPARAASILAGLGFNAPAQAGPIGALSGGERMRVALAGALFAEPEVLLLDEPTNHLDLEAAMWLEEALAAYGKTLVIVSHDRELLNRAVDAILHLDDGKLTFYNGNFDTFENTRRLKLSLAAKEADKQQAQRKHMQAFVDRFRAKATKAKQAQSRLKAIAKLPTLASVVEPAPVVFRIPEPNELPSPLIALDEVAIGYGGKPVLKRLSLRIDMDDRIALLGANGNGKSTLSKLLAGKLSPMAGEQRRHNKLRVGYFAQNQAESLDPQRNAVEHLAALMPKATETRLRALLGGFGLTEERGTTRVRDLSGGEKARLLLALLCREEPHILILDEPTNHLDIDSRAALIEALGNFGGAVVLVSHDPHLVRLVADRLWLVEGGQCRPFDGDLDDYHTHLLKERRLVRRQQAAPAASARRVEERKPAAPRGRAELAPLRKAVNEAEARLARLSQARAQVEAALADPALYSGKSDKVAELSRLKARLDGEIKSAEEAWLLAESRLEAGA